MKPQFYFNAKNTSQQEVRRQIQVDGSDMDSKESTSKTPWFIGTPTSNSQLGSLNGTGAVKAEDLIRAMKNQTGKYLHYLNFLDVWRKIQFSSSNSSSEKLGYQIQGIHSSAPVMSFGGESNSDYINEQNNEYNVYEYKNSQNDEEFDTFRH